MSEAKQAKPDSPWHTAKQACAEFGAPVYFGTGYQLGPRARWASVTYETRDTYAVCRLTEGSETVRYFLNGERVSGPASFRGPMAPKVMEAARSILQAYARDEYQ